MGEHMGRRARREPLGREQAGRGTGDRVLRRGEDRYTGATRLLGTSMQGHAGMSAPRRSRAARGRHAKRGEGDGSHGRRVRNAGARGEPGGGGEPWQAGTMGEIWPETMGAREWDA